MSPTKRQLVSFAVLGAVTYPIARFAGEGAAALVCIVAAIAIGLSSTQAR